MKKYLSLVAIAFLISPLFCFSQTDKKAQDILSGVSAKYKSFNSVKADFSIQIENSADKANDKQKGSIILKGKKYKLEIANQEIVNDGVTNWTYLKDVNEIQISDASSNEDAISPANIFTMYEKGFLYKFIDEKSEGGKQIQNIELTPIDKKKKYFKIKLEIDKLEKLVVSAKIFDKNGNHYTYNVEKYLPNFPAQDGLFSLDAKAHPKAEIVDLR